MKRSSLVLLSLVTAVLGCGRSQPDGDAKLRAELESTKAEVARLQAEVTALKEAGTLTQSGMVELRLGEIEVFYPRAYVREPELTFPTRYAVTFQVIKQTPSGFRIEVTNLSRGTDSPPNSLEWRARGEVPK